MGVFKKRQVQEDAEAHNTKNNDTLQNKTRGGIFGLRRNRPWIFWGIMFSLFGAFVFSCFYGIFRDNAERYMESPVETMDNISWLYQSCYLLYRDLENSRHEEQLDYTDIYLDVQEEYQWILNKDELAAYLMTYLYYGEDIGETEEAENRVLYPEGEYSLNLEDGRSLERELELLNSYFTNLNDSFQILNSSYDYIIKDNKTGKYVTNMSADGMNRDPSLQYFYLSFVFDSAGNVTVGEGICGRNESQIRKFANGALREDSLQSRAARNMNVFFRYGSLRPPVDCTVTFSISREAWEAIEKDGRFGEVALHQSGSDLGIYFHVYNYGGGSASVNAFIDAGVGGILLLSMLGIALLAVILPLGGTKPWKEDRICALSLEFLIVFGCFVTAMGNVVMEMIAGVASGNAQKALQQYVSVSATDAETLVKIFNLLVLTLFFFSGWYMGICARALRDLRPKEYIRQKSMIYSFFPYMKRKITDVYRSMVHVDLTGNVHKTIIKIVLVNGIILLIISFLWFGGMALTAVYSIILYFILRKYVNDLQKKYRILLKAVDEIAEGKLNVAINEDLGVFEPFRSQVFKIQDGLQKAVDTEFRSQQMKVELITNMSHDLKTPLTAIITYVNLLKEENLTEEQSREYLATLERKSLRLKSLIEDLFEFSKASSNNVTLNIMDVDIMNLVKQVAFEMSEKISEASLDVRMNLTEERVVIPLDSQKTFRIYENLFGNIAKYALKGTRVYVNGFRIDDTVVITLKNISAQEITVDASDLTERFVRGDASRNTEGSGLGLAIAKSFTELQGGQLHLEVDGDLFKATTTWHIQNQNSYPKAPTDSL